MLHYVTGMISLVWMLLAGYRILWLNDHEGSERASALALLWLIVTVLSSEAMV